MSKVEALLSELNRELEEQKQSVIDEAVKSALDEIKIKPENLSKETLNMIMAAKGRTTAQQPVPQPPEMPDETIYEAMAMDANTDAIISDVLAGNNVYLYGLAGTGKSVLAQDVAEKILKRGYYTINCSQWTSPTEIRGGQTITGYEQGTMIKAWQEGKILILDELPKLDPNTAGLLNECLSKTADQIVDRKGKKNIPTITDGKGDRIEKGGGDSEKAKLFGVIATGNTDMKTVSQNFSGNNRQDYSLIDRFAGSFYEIKFNLQLENELIYPHVLEISRMIRDFLITQRDTIEAITLRTMLNFNRTYEMFMLKSIRSPLVANTFSSDMKPKTLEASVMSFIDSLNTDMKQELLANTEVKQLLAKPADKTEFIEQFKSKHNGINPRTGKKD